MKSDFRPRRKCWKTKGFTDCLLLFHGTPQKNVESILKNNFDTSIIANGRACGNGVYFSECPDVSIGYSGRITGAKKVKGKKVKKQQQQEDQGQQVKATTSLILCKVLLGDNSTEHKHGREERCWAIVVPDVDQILPKYVINFN